MSRSGHLPRRHVFRERNALDPHPFKRRLSRRWTASGEPAAAEPWDGFPPPRCCTSLHLDHDPVRVAIAALLTKKLDAEWLVAVRKWTIVSWLSSASAWLSACGGPTSSWAGAILGLGSGRKRGAFWLVIDRLLAFVNDSGKARHAEEMEPRACHWDACCCRSSGRSSRARRDRECALVHAIAVGFFFLGFLVVAAIASAIVYVNRYPCLRPSDARVGGQPRGELPLQQSASSLASRFSTVGHTVSDHF